MLALLLAAVLGAQGAPGPARAPTDPDAPFHPGSWGLGFRVLGDNTDLRILRAWTPRFTTGLEFAWNGYYTDIADEEILAVSPFGAPADISDGTWYGVFELRVGFPLEWAIADRGPVHMVAGLAPYYTFTSDGTLSGLARDDDNDDVQQGFGIVSSLGFLWEFQPGLFLTSSFGADASRTSMVVDESEEDFQQHAEYTKLATRSWFGGIGLDAWF